MYDCVHRSLWHKKREWIPNTARKWTVEMELQ